MSKLAGVRDRLLFVFILFLGCLATGTFGYRFIEGWPLFDSLYMTVITIATVGYGETHPLSHAGRVFTMFMILGGIGVFTYGFTAITAIVVEGELAKAFRRMRMEQSIAHLSGHFIICGAGHTGGVVCGELKKTGRDFVVVDRDPAAIATLAKRLGFDLLHIVGDGSDDAVLRSAGVERAAGVFAVLATDQDNAFVVLSAKGLNPKAKVLACQKTLGVREKLMRSGADGVVDPEFIGGLRLASEMIRPVTVGFLDSMLRNKDSHFRFDEISIPPDSALIGRPVGAVKGGEGGCPLVVAVVAAGSDVYELNPPVDRPVRAGDRLVILGETEALGGLRKRVLA
ncbi:MAG: NAD-binding protein [Elusimicrobia bacterium]|nr:NAD-binding protein [Elusimicrobiota bacterium]